MDSKHVCLWIFKSGLYVKGKIRMLSLTQETQETKRSPSAAFF